MKTNPLNKISDLKRGDIIRHKDLGDSYVVDLIFDERAIVVRVMTISNPIEWEVVIDV